MGRAGGLLLLAQACGKSENDETIPDLSPYSFNRHDPEDVAAAHKVLKKFTLPDYWAQTRHFYPGIEYFPANGQGSMVSCVYNRGGVQGGDHGIEERAIRDILAEWDKQSPGLAQVVERCAHQLRAMARIWPHDHGLRLRREQEAELMESCLVAENNTVFDTEAA